MLSCNFYAFPFQFELIANGRYTVVIIVVVFIMCLEKWSDGTAASDGQTCSNAFTLYYQLDWPFNLDGKRY